MTRASLRGRMGAWAIGMDFAWTVVGAVLLGILLDWLFKTGPTFLLIFMVAGLIGGFTVFLRAGLKAARESGGRSQMSEVREPEDQRIRRSDGGDQPSG
jgi:F0F1-type ATP synthase assembly protein I